MDLTEKYMEIQGTLGYLHVSSWDSSNNYVLAYSTEGSQLQYTYCAKEEEADQLIDHWGKTGELVLENFNFYTQKFEKQVERPTMVRKLLGVESFRRKLYPQHLE